MPVTQANLVSLWSAKDQQLSVANVVLNSGHVEMQMLCSLSLVSMKMHSVLFMIRS
jgi:hypothetical protein